MNYVKQYITKKKLLCMEMNDNFLNPKEGKKERKGTMEQEELLNLDLSVTTLNVNSPVDPSNVIFYQNG